VKCLVCVALGVFLISAAAAGEEPNGQFSVPMRVFTGLLKIPFEPPDVNATVHSKKEEDGLVIEDVSWPSLDGETVPAFLVRRAKTAELLPAILCLH